MREIDDKPDEDFTLPVVRSKSVVQNLQEQINGNSIRYSFSFDGSVERIRTRPQVFENGGRQLPIQSSR